LVAEFWDFDENLFCYSWQLSLVTRTAFCTLRCHRMDRLLFFFLSLLILLIIILYFCLLSYNTCINTLFLYLLQTIVTGAGDETLRFWNVFPSPKSQVKNPKHIRHF